MVACQAVGVGDGGEARLILEEPGRGQLLRTCTG